MTLADKYRPRSWSDVVGQPKALAIIESLRKRGLAGRAVWIAGKSGTGKTTIAELLAAEIAHECCIERYTARTMTPADVLAIRRGLAFKGMERGGRAVIVNESHGLRSDTEETLLDALDKDAIPPHALWIFTTTVDGQAEFCFDNNDALPLLSRCLRIDLAQRDLAKAFAERAREIAQLEGLDGQPIERYVKLANECKSNLRAMLSAIEGGRMLS